MEQINEQTILKITGDKNFESKEDSKNYVKRLASACETVIMKHGVVNLRSVGASSLNNAVKAIAILVDRGSKKEIPTEYSCIPMFDTASFGDLEKTAIVFKVVIIKK